MGMSHRAFFDRTRNGRSIAGLRKDAREKGIVIIKDWYLKKKKFKWVIYKVKMKRFLAIISTEWVTVSCRSGTIMILSGSV